MTLLEFFGSKPQSGRPPPAPVLPALRFCPTGGIDACSAPGYLGLPIVVAVGGSWLTLASAIAREDWAAVTTLSRAAAVLRTAGRVS